MKILKMLFIVLIVVAAFLLLNNAAESSGVIMAMAVVSGPFIELKWAGITFNPTEDGEAKYKPSGKTYEVKMSPNDVPYSEMSAHAGYVSQECVFTPTEFEEFLSNQDGEPRAGTATAPNGDVLTLNCAIDGEMELSNGKCEVKLSGLVKLQ